ncbi:putative zinc finger BED domain-containing protein 1-like [Daphnia sinensis]|uniref:Zinc finger BED domain-containing protein 1-like n=1 Tax=Daphnia sinensis TaxID=1820382 RepID=A0AAD5PKR8_9CRUS|nr:putative zinc finger BED domain-containing protein 1-like [Daphnia sinensis]
MTEDTRRNTPPSNPRSSHRRRGEELHLLPQYSSTCIAVARMQLKPVFRPRSASWVLLLDGVEASVSTDGWITNEGDSSRIGAIPCPRDASSHHGRGHFLAFLNAVDPKIVLPCHKMLTHSLLTEMYAEAKAKQMTELFRTKHVSLTADCSMSLTIASYMTVTAHFIKGQPKMISRVLSTLVLEVSHTSENIAAHLRPVIGSRTMHQISRELYPEQMLKYCHLPSPQRTCYSEAQPTL